MFPLASRTHLKNASYGLVTPASCRHPCGQRLAGETPALRLTVFEMASSYNARARVVALLLVFALVLAGCGEPETLPPDQVLQKAVPAIGAANSFHFNLETSKLKKSPPGLFITKAEGDVAKPDKLVGDLNATFGGIPINVKVVVDGKSQYMTDPASGKWTTMGASFNVVEFFDPSKGVSDILSSVKNVSADGTETIEGTPSYRLKGSVPAVALKSLSPEVTATGDLTTTLWIGSADFLMRRVRLQGPILTGEPAEIERTITVTDYNKEVKVETPAVK